MIDIHSWCHQESRWPHRHLPVESAQVRWLRDGYDQFNVWFKFTLFYFEKTYELIGTVQVSPHTQEGLTKSNLELILIL